MIDFNLKDTISRAPYGQELFVGIVADTTSAEEFQKIKKTLMSNARNYFKPLYDKNLDAILSINNYHAAYSAVAEYPNLTVPMGYKNTGEPISLTFIGKPRSELDLFMLGYAFEKQTAYRKLPVNYQ